MLLVLSEQAATTNPDLILLPELATTPYFAAGDKSPKYRDWAEPVVGGASTAAFAKFAKDHLIATVKLFMAKRMMEKPIQRFAS